MKASLFATLLTRVLTGRFSKGPLQGSHTSSRSRSDPEAGSSQSA